LGVLIDASILIEHERGRVSLGPHLAGREQEEFFLSVITASELLHGVHRATDASVRARRAAFVEAALERFPLFPVDLAIARAHAQLWAGLMAERAGVRAGSRSGRGVVGQRAVRYEFHAQLRSLWRHTERPAPGTRRP
jgi:tRNA(fMet)-specific endonuclease VapC